MREYVVLKEHKKSPEEEAHLVIAGVVKAHDQEAAIRTIHEAEVLPADQKQQSNSAYRAVPKTYFEPLITVKRIVTPSVEYVRSTKPIARPRRQPKQSPALPLAQGPVEDIATSGHPGPSDADVSAMLATGSPA